MADSKTINLTLNDQQKPYELPILSGSLGPDVIDIRRLHAQTGLFTYDPGFTSTAACTSKITFIDGDAGVLLYRGYPIEQLAEKCDFLEVCYLLLNGELPNGAEMKSFVTRISQHVMVHEQLTKFYSGFRRDAHPMAVLVGVVGALSAFYHDVMDITSREDRYMSAIRLIAKMPTMVAMCYKYSIGMPFMYPKRKLGYAENFMRMMHGDPGDDYLANPVLVRALDRILILHA
ncbi:MAG: citrate/2-methylcitrate synthase, partial [Methylomonas sp.]